MGRAAQALPNDSEAHSNLGAALRRAGRLDDSLVSFRHAIRLMPGIAEVHNNLGNTLMDLGRFDEAIQAFRRALDLKPDFDNAHNNLGNALRDRGKTSMRRPRVIGARSRCDPSMQRRLPISVLSCVCKAALPKPK